MQSSTGPSWAMPITIGAGLTIVGFGLLQLIAAIGGLASVASCCCLAPSACAPIGFLTIVWARRRDPLLTPGQAFAIVFIGAGLGSLSLAATASLLTMPGRDELASLASQAVDDVIAQQGRPLTAEERQAMIDLFVSTAPYTPLLFAAWHTLTAAIVGLFTASLSQRRYEPPLHLGDHDG